MYSRLPTKYKKLVMIIGDYHVEYCVRDSFDRTECIYVALLNIRRLFVIIGDYHVKYCVRNSLDMIKHALNMTFIVEYF